VVVYWLMFAFPASITFLLGEKRTGTRGRLALALLFIVFVILIGLRYDTGGDWGNYQNYSEDISFQSLGTVMSDGEAGFAFVTWVSTQLGWDIYGSTMFCGIVLMYAIVQFARRQPDSWLALTAAVPYLIIVVGMGYIRQAAAIGFVMLALVNFQENKRLRCGVYIVLATLFHTSALVIIPFIAIVILRKKNPLYIIPVVAGSLPAFFFLLGDRYDRMVNYYINIEYDSSGALVRLLMNAIPSILFLLYRKRFEFSEDVRFLWSMFAVASCLLIGGFVVSPSSTVVDRLGLYMIPIQLMVFGHLPRVLARKPADARLISFFCVLYFALVQFVWLNFATNANVWLPYRSLLTI
jgi:hypothetical protein